MAVIRKSSTNPAPAHQDEGSAVGKADFLIRILVHHFDGGHFDLSAIDEDHDSSLR